MLERVRPTTAVLFLPAETRRADRRQSLRPRRLRFSYRARACQSQVITFPGLTHFQPYSGTGFEVGSTLAADWFAKFLGGKK